MFTESSAPLVRLVICLVLSFLLISIDYRQGHLGTLRQVLSGFVEPVYLVIDAPITLSRAGVEYLSSRRRVLASNELLEAENAELRFRLQRLEALERENQRLRELLETADIVGNRSEAARLLAVASRPSTREIQINKGLLHGVYSGQPVMHADGILGQVTRVGPISSTVMLVSDVRHHIPAVVNRSGVTGTAYGTESGEYLELNFVPNNADVQVGDLITTSGIGGVFPRDHPIGHVASIDVDPAENFAHITILPVASLGNTREVLLIWSDTTELADSNAFEEFR